MRRSDGEETLDPFRVVMTSPAFTPALDAGESDVGYGGGKFSVHGV